MELIYFDEFVKINKNNVVACIGQFDGVHAAHQILIKKTVEIGNRLNLKKIIISFEPHPAIVLNPKGQFSVLTPLKEKVRLLQKFDLDYLVIMPFTLELAHTEPINFVRNYLTKMNITNLVAGFDFTYGDRGKGLVKDIKKFSDNAIDVTIIDEITYNSDKISSSRIRECLINGNLEEVHTLFGHYYSFYGDVIHGKSVGHKVGVPTANLKVDEHFIPLKSGVYSVNVFINGTKYRGILNKGHNPSFNYVENESIEVFIIDCDEKLYDMKLRIELLEYLREEKKFATIDDFKSQIELDKNRSINFVEK